VRLGYRTLAGRICEEHTFRARLSNLRDCKLSGQNLDRRIPTRALLSRHNRGPGFWRDNKKIVQSTFSKFPKIKSVQLVGSLALRDKRGNATVDRAVMVKFSKLNAATIKWEDVDPANVVEIADKHWILPEWAADKK
jgi:hypothetical protein